MFGKKVEGNSHRVTFEGGGPTVHVDVSKAVAVEAARLCADSGGQAHIETKPNVAAVLAAGIGAAVLFGVVSSVFGYDLAKSSCEGDNMFATAACAFVKPKIDETGQDPNVKPVYDTVKHMAEVGK